MPNRQNAKLPKCHEKNAKESKCLATKMLSNLVLKQLYIHQPRNCNAKHPK